MASTHENTGSGQFPMTRWTLIQQIRDGGETEAFEALDEICSAYWYPIYAFLRRTGAPPEDAADLTQEFFNALIAKGFIAGADRDRGKLRSFLLGALKKYRSIDYRAKMAQKRGAGAVHVPIDLQWAEGRFENNEDRALTPEAAYDKEWALLLLERVQEQLKGEFDARDKAGEFGLLMPHLAWNEGGASYAEIAAQLGTSEGNVKVKVKRLRDRYRCLLEQEVRETLSSGKAEDELRHLLAAL